MPTLQDILSVVWAVGESGGTHFSEGPASGEIKERRIPLDGTTKKSRWLRRPINFHANEIEPMLGDEIRLTDDGRRIYIQRTYRLIMDEYAVRAIANTMVDWLPELPASVKPVVEAYKAQRTLGTMYQVFLIYAFRCHRQISQKWWNPKWWWIRLESGSLFQG